VERDQQLVQPDTGLAEGHLSEQQQQYEEEEAVEGPSAHHLRRHEVSTISYHYCIE